MEHKHESALSLQPSNAAHPQLGTQDASLLAQLKVLGQLYVGDKLSTRSQNITIDAPAWFRGARRWVNGEGRSFAHTAAAHVVNRAMERLNQCAAEQSTLWLAKAYITDLREAQRGLHNLQLTYTRCPQTVANFQVLSQSIDVCCDGCSNQLAAATCARRQGASKQRMVRLPSPSISPPHSSSLTRATASASGAPRQKRSATHPATHPAKIQNQQTQIQQTQIQHPVDGAAVERGSSAEGAGRAGAAADDCTHDSFSKTLAFGSEAEETSETSYTSNVECSDEDDDDDDDDDDDYYSNNEDSEDSSNDIDVPALK